MFDGHSIKQSKETLEKMYFYVTPENSYFDSTRFNINRHKNLKYVVYIRKRDFFKTPIYGVERHF